MSWDAVMTTIMPLLRLLPLLLLLMMMLLLLMMLLLSMLSQVSLFTRYTAAVGVRTLARVHTSRIRRRHRTPLGLQQIQYLGCLGTRRDNANDVNVFIYKTREDEVTLERPRVRNRISAGTSARRVWDDIIRKIDSSQVRSLFI